MQARDLRRSCPSRLAGCPQAGEIFEMYGANWARKATVTLAHILCKRFYSAATTAGLPEFRVHFDPLEKREFCHMDKGLQEKLVLGAISKISDVFSCVSQSSAIVALLCRTCVSLKQVCLIRFNSKASGTVVTVQKGLSRNHSKFLHFT